MPDPLQKQDVTRFLAGLGRGDTLAADRLLPVVYDELRDLAGRFFQGQPGGQTLQPTALVHEAYLRLVDQTRAGWLDRAHFFNIAAKAMRQILVDHARRRRAAKRGGNWGRISLAQVGTNSPASEVDVLDLDEALTELAALDERQARIVELRFLAGLTVEETAAVLGISARTVKLRWRQARAWLRRRLGDRGAE
jgi:RNA polymerase sigma factor (TIGR02999 family)